MPEDRKISERTEEAFEWGRIKGALVRKYPELKQWLEDRERATGGFKNLVEELIYTTYLRERFGIRGMTLHDVMNALDVAGEVIDKAREVLERLRGFEATLKGGDFFEKGKELSSYSEVRAEFARALANVVSAITSLINMTISGLRFPMTGLQAQQMLQQSNQGAETIDVDRVISDIQ